MEKPSESYQRQLGSVIVDKCIYLNISKTFPNFNKSYNEYRKFLNYYPNNAVYPKNTIRR